ncbi:uncharacterized protein GGS25DRAFT_510349 [Hypoxylon fragiforme]|uniref:uncharacterized protein n=1 Tax=Hypoxylon fragiforme TaxID=63214 RepID=UPI0020C687DB|nr:uncharacterized protein GGS25DRAFT_510349 [Hypoxylon fragiforme]KAI2603187.1 hypothetical protein GGS25DRAFT_510349 [Hypoxylon fragiforme]
MIFLARLHATTFAFYYNVTLFARFILVNRQSPQANREGFNRRVLQHMGVSCIMRCGVLFFLWPSAH